MNYFNSGLWWMIDPIGISGLANMRDAINRYQNTPEPGLKEYADLGLSALSCIPVIGKVGKLAKAGNAIINNARMLPKISHLARRNLNRFRINHNLYPGRDFSNRPRLEYFQYPKFDKAAKWQDVAIDLAPDSVGSIANGTYINDKFLDFQ